MKKLIVGGLLASVFAFSFALLPQVASASIFTDVFNTIFGGGAKTATTQQIPANTQPSITLRLSPNSPVSSTFPQYQNGVTFAVIDLKAGDTPVTNMNKIQIASDSRNEATKVTNIKVYDGSTLIGTASNLINNGSYYYQWIAVSGLSLPANTWKSLKIVADIPYYATSSVRLGIAGLNFDAPGATAAGLPVYGSDMYFTIIPAADAKQPSITSVRSVLASGSHYDLAIIGSGFNTGTPTRLEFTNTEVKGGASSFADVQARSSTTISFGITLPAGRYTIRASNNNEASWGAPFSADIPGDSTTQPSITVLSPNSGTTVALGESINVSWTSASPLQPVDVKILDSTGNVLPKPILLNMKPTSANAQSLGFATTPTGDQTLPLGDYKARVCSAGTNNCSDSVSFKIIPAVTGVSPHISQILPQPILVGSYLTVNVSNAGRHGNIILQTRDGTKTWSTGYATNISGLNGFSLYDGSKLKFVIPATIGRGVNPGMWNEPTVPLTPGKYNLYLNSIDSDNKFIKSNVILVQIEGPTPSPSPTVSPTSRPSITSIRPTTGTSGTAISIYGSGFQIGDYILVSGLGVAATPPHILPNSVSTSQIIFNMPSITAGATYWIQVGYGNYLSNTVQLNPANSTINVISPKVGDTFAAGQTIDLKWTPGIPGITYVNFYKDDSSYSTAARVQNNPDQSGLMRYTFPANMPAGNYKIFAFYESTSNGSTGSAKLYESIGYFTITSATTAPPPVTCPAGYICNPVGSASYCPSGYTCQGVTSSCPSGYTCTTFIRSVQTISPSPSSSPSTTPTPTTSTSPAPTATLDQSSLSTTSNHPRITGTAHGVNAVGLSIGKNGGKFDGTSTFSTDQYGNWGVTLNNQTYEPGTYQIDVYSDKNVLLISGTLTVTGNTTQPTSTSPTPTTSTSPSSSPTTTSSPSSSPSSSTHASASDGYKSVLASVLYSLGDFVDSLFSK